EAHRHAGFVRWFTDAHELAAPKRHGATRERRNGPGKVRLEPGLGLRGAGVYAEQRRELRRVAAARPDPAREHRDSVTGHHAAALVQGLERLGVVGFELRDVLVGVVSDAQRAAARYHSREEHGLRARGG